MTGVGDGYELAAIRGGWAGAWVETRSSARNLDLRDAVPSRDLLNGREAVDSMPRR